MAHRVLIVNGCSCARGEELENPETDSWPSVVGKGLDLALMNIATNGASNRRIVRSTVATCSALLHDAEVDASETVVVVAWTHLARSEYYNPRERPERRRDRSEFALEVDRGWHRIGPWRRRHRPSRAYFRKLWSPEGDVHNFLTDWAMLDAWLRSSGFTGRYVFTFPILEDLLFAKSIVLLVDASSIFGGWTAGASMLEVSDGLPRGRGGHPLVEGHAAFAQDVGEWLRGSLSA